MKVPLFAAIVALCSSGLEGFTVSRTAPSRSVAFGRFPSVVHRPVALASSGSDFDFPSAMPEKPQLTMEQRMEQSADDFVESMTQALGEGVEPPPELEELKKLRETDASPPQLALKIYELMIERGMRYDEAPETGTLTPTEFNIKENLDIKEVQDEFAHLYKYGMMLMDRGLLTADEIKSTVLTRLIDRTGLSPEEFDKWLGY